MEEKDRLALEGGEQSKNLSIPWNEFVREDKSRLTRIFYWLFKFLDYPATFPINFKNRQDFLFLPETLSAKKHWRHETISLLITLTASLALLLGLVIYVTGLSLLTFISSLIAFFYFAMMAFKLFVVYKSIAAPFIEVSEKELQALKKEDLPSYTILVPLYREEKVIPQVIKAMTAIDYPPEKLKILITLEKHDWETQAAIAEIGLPAHFQVVMLPKVPPQTKPKALNVAFLKAEADFLVIYDAEILPDPDQLKKAWVAFRKNPELGCLQTRLDHYNTNQNLLTKLFNAEFSFYYDLFLPGLQRLDLPIPLSGHSTHFRYQALKEIGAWDPYNVTEDCDTGMRLYRRGYRTAVLDSFSREEATSTLDGWIRQRTRWMKGFIQTSLVHLRHPFRFKTELGGWKNFFGFLLIVPSTAAVNVFNLLYWFIFVSWMTTHSPLIKSFFPGPILYLSVITFVTGNIIFTYLNILGVYRRGRYNLVKFSALSPIYWILLAIATTRAFIQMITKPHHWEKTTHGLHLK